MTETEKRAAALREYQIMNPPPEQAFERKKNAK